MRSLTLTLLALSAVLASWACSPSDADVAGENREGAETHRAEDTDGSRLGPVDGHDLPPADLERVQDGDLAPDFTLEVYDGPPATLSGFRGERNVVLMFYRGHW